MKTSVYAAIALIATLGLSACGGPRAFTQGQYGDPEEISMLDDKWNQNDMQLVAKKVVKIIKPEIKKSPPVVEEVCELSYGGVMHDG